MIIDSHMHAGRADALTDSWTTFEDIDISLARMDAYGIDKAVVLPIFHPDFRVANRETAAIVAAHPDRLYGYAKVHQEHDKGRISDLLDEAFGVGDDPGLGLLGLKIHGHPNREMMDALDRHRRPLLADVGGKVRGLRYVAECYPAVPIIVAHMGQFKSNPDAHLNTLWLAARYENVYFDTSSVMEHEWLERAVAEGLVHKMIYGSDGPVCHCGVELERIRALRLSPEDEDMVLCGTISRLLGVAATANIRE